MTTIFNHVFSPERTNRPVKRLCCLGIFFASVEKSINFNLILTMGRREELERELEEAQLRIENAPDDTPQDWMDAYHRELDSIQIELNNLYDDPETETE